MWYRSGRLSLGYVLALAASFGIAMIAGWTSLADRIDGTAYDWMFQIRPPQAHPPQSVVLAIDEATLRERGGVRSYRQILADTLNAIRGAEPKVIAIDVLLGDEGDPGQDRALTSALNQSRSVVLPADIDPTGKLWEEPRAAFAEHAAAIGHVHTQDDPIARILPLKEVAARKRRWAVALEAFRVYRGAPYIVESPGMLEVAGLSIPVGKADDDPMYIRYLPLDRIPQIPVADLLRNPALRGQVRGKAVFIGVTALSAAHDRPMTPYQRQVAGVEIHAQAFETMLNGIFLQPASNLMVFGVSILLTVLAGLTFLLLSGWPSYAVGGILVLSAHALPHLLFSRGTIFPLLFPVLAAWLSVATAATWMHFIVRRQLRKSETDRARYQQAIHFVTHEMRSPLTAIQGSSELMGRYALSEDKRKQMAQMINSESKRLARMIQTFLDIERLSHGQMELRTETIETSALLGACIKRAQPLAERKQIRLLWDDVESPPIQADRELMEYAVYNLLTNAIKYSPAETEVNVGVRPDGSLLRISVADQGIGMDEKEIRKIFQKFYRTKKAENSGEVGTGIGLSIVDQIVAHHGGRIEVTSTPGQGSCFTMVLPRGITPSPVPASTLASS